MDFEERRKKVLENLIPYDSPQELERRVRSLFNFWDNDHNDPYPKVQYGRNSTRGVLLWYATGEVSRDHPVHEETQPLIWFLPPEHDIAQEMVNQARSHLQELVKKPAVDLRQHNPRYLNSLFIAGASGRLPNELEAAAFYMVEMDLLSDGTPPEELEIVAQAVSGMFTPLDDQEHPSARRLFNLIREKQVCIPFIINQILEYESPKEATKILIGFYNIADGKYKFEYLGVKRDVGFMICAMGIKEASPDFDFKKIIDEQAQEHLRENLYGMFSVNRK